MTKQFLIWSAVYLACGVATAGYSAYLYQAGKPHFDGFSPEGGAVAGLLETVFVWPYALYVDFTKK